MRALLAALLLVLGLAAAACSGGGGSAGADAPPPSPALFAVADADGTPCGWLFGTIHALPEGTRWRTPAIAEASAQAGSLVVEVAGLGDSDRTARLFRDLAATPDLPPLAERVPPEHRDRLSALAAKAGLNAAQQRQTESWAAAVMLARLSADGSPVHGVDRALLRDFSERPIRELEGAAGQLAIFDRLPEEAQRALLVAVIAASDPARDEAARLRQAWLAGDVVALEAALQRGMMADPRLREALLLARNRAWLAPIEAELRSQRRPLVAVGAAHIVGPEGLVALLEERGWRVTRLT